jgi:hypothetical protein
MTMHNRKKTTDMNQRRVLEMRGRKGCPGRHVRSKRRSGVVSGLAIIG